MLRSINDLHNLVAEGIDGSIGRIADLYFDDQAWTIRFMVVETDAWLEGRKVLISPVATGEPDWHRSLLPVSVTREQVRKSPDVDSQQPVSRQHEIEHAAYYGYPRHWGGAGIWGDSMRPQMMLAFHGGAMSPKAERQQTEFVQAQADAHRRRGDDPHLRSTRAMIRYHMQTTDGKIGHVDGMIVDDETWTIRYLVVNTSDWWLGHQVLVAPHGSATSTGSRRPCRSISAARPSYTRRHTTPTRCPITSRKTACTNTMLARATGPGKQGRESKLAPIEVRAALSLPVFIDRHKFGQL